MGVRGLGRKGGAIGKKSIIISHARTPYSRTPCPPSPPSQPLNPCASTPQWKFGESSTDTVGCRGMSKRTGTVCQSCRVFQGRHGRSSQYSAPVCSLLEPRRRSSLTPCPSSPPSHPLNPCASSSRWKVGKSSNNTVGCRRMSERTGAVCQSCRVLRWRH